MHTSKLKILQSDNFYHGIASYFTYIPADT